MKTAKSYFDEYALSHQNETNIAIHYICVPLIFFSVIGLLMSIPTTFLENLFGLYNPLLENWAIVIGAFISIFYIRLGFWYFAQMLFVILLCVVLNFWLSNLTNLFYASLSIFIIAWIGQFYGHKVEGAKPSFLKDLQFLLIGPLWVIQKLELKTENYLRYLHIKYNNMATVDTIRNGLIDKILAIKNKDFLVALDTLISSSEATSTIVEISEEQKIMLQMSEEDIKNGKLISQEAMDKRNLEWLNAL